MKFLSAANATETSRSPQTGLQVAGLTISGEGTLLTLGVALAFAFVTACLFMLG